MCGICGMIDLRLRNRIDPDILWRMNKRLEHRGPDQADIKILGNVGMGFTRLSIIDLLGGMQPLYNEDHSLVLICNGEIFNYKELMWRFPLVKSSPVQQLNDLPESFERSNVRNPQS